MRSPNSDVSYSNSVFRDIIVILGYNEWHTAIDPAVLITDFRTGEAVLHIAANLAYLSADIILSKYVC